MHITNITGARMNFYNYVKSSKAREDDSENINEHKKPREIRLHEKRGKKNKTDDEYFAELDDATGERYSIPMLTNMSDQYFVRYVAYMKLKEKNPTEFARVMSWN